MPGWIAGNECAGALAKYQACHGNSLPVETNIRTAGPGGNPFFDISWLAVEVINQQESGTEASQHSPRLTYKGYKGLQEKGLQSRSATASLLIKKYQCMKGGIKLVVSLAQNIVEACGRK